MIIDLLLMISSVQAADGWQTVPAIKKKSNPPTPVGSAQGHGQGQGGLRRDGPKIGNTSIQGI